MSQGDKEEKTEEVSAKQKSATKKDEPSSSSSNKESKKKDDSGGGEKKEEPELSPEDQALLEGLELAVERLQDVDENIQKMALEHLVKEVRAATSSMTSVPKPLKFLRPHYETLKTAHRDDKIAATLKSPLADLLAVLAMTMAAPGSRECLEYKMMGTPSDLGSWGHEFVRSLAGEIGEEYAKRQIDGSSSTASSPGAAAAAAEASASSPARIRVDDLLALVDEIVPFHLQHNAEAEAIDLLMETQQLFKVRDLAHRGLIDDTNYQRICLYLCRCAAYMADPDDLAALLDAAFHLYRAQGQFCDALRVALSAAPLEGQRGLLLREDDAQDDDDDDDKEKMEDEEEESFTFKRLKKLFDEAPDSATRKQMAFVAARHGPSKFEYEEDPEVNELLGNGTLHAYFKALAKDLDVADPKTPEDIYKSHLGDTYSSSASSSSSSSRAAQRASADSARANLASTFVNGFVNAGFGTDSLMTVEGNEWLYKNKDHGMLSAAASLGLITLWDVEEGLTKIDKFLHSTDDNVKAGACLAIGVVSANVRHEADPPAALLPEYLELPAGGNDTAPPAIVRLAATTALGIAYAGCARDDAKELLLPLAEQGDDPALAAHAGLALGQIFVGTCDSEVAATLVQRLMESPDSDLDMPITKFLALGLALVFFGAMDRADATLEALKTIDHEIGRYASVSLEACAYAGTGNVLKIQRMLHICAERLGSSSSGGAEQSQQSTSAGGAATSSSKTSSTSTEEPASAAAESKDSDGGDVSGSSSTNRSSGGPVEEAKGVSSSSSATTGGPRAGTSAAGSQTQSTGSAAAAAKEPTGPTSFKHQSVAVVGIALVTAGEDVGGEMALRTFDHLLHYGEPAVRRAVPLGLALLKVCNPEYAVVDAMSRLTHDADAEVASSAILGLGLLGCGTNNSRVAGLLRQLAEHSRDANHLFVVRVAQGLLHMGKGLVTVNPFHSDRFLLNKTAAAGLLVVLHAALDAKHTILDKYHYLLFHLATAMTPRMLFTVDADSLELLPASVRVGQAVETVGQAGKPKTITGFQTHTTPVLLGVNDRAELANDDFKPLTNTLEGVVILNPNPDAASRQESSQQQNGAAKEDASQPRSGESPGPQPADATVGVPSGVGGPDAAAENQKPSSEPPSGTSSN